MVGPWLHSLWKSGKTLSDIEYLAIKEFDGKLVKNEGGVTAAGDIATLTASGGKDMYIARAKVNIFMGAANAGTSSKDEVVLKINGTIVETVKSSMVGSSATGMTSWAYEFKNIGHKVAATQIIVLEAITVDTDTEMEGFIECFEESTGASPAI